MARKTNRVSVASPRTPRKVKQVSGNAKQMKKLKELQGVTKELEKRSKVSGKLFDKQRKLKEQLGLDPF